MPGGYVDLAYMHISMYDAVNAIDGRYSVFAVHPTNVPAGSSKEAAAIAAAYSVLIALYPAQHVVLDANYASSLAAIPDSQGKADGIAVGAEVASLFLASRAGDGRDAPITYTPGSGPGAWIPTSPIPPAVVYLSQMRPFAMETASQFRADGPPALTSHQYTEDFNEIKNLGCLDCPARTEEQRVIGLFYTDPALAQTGRAFRQVAHDYPMSLADNARLFAMLYVALADAAIGSVESKYYYGFWRPITAIRAADTDGNPNTLADPELDPVIHHSELSRLCIHPFGDVGSIFGDAAAILWNQECQFHDDQRGDRYNPAFQQHGRYQQRDHRRSCLCRFPFPNGRCSWGRHGEKDRETCRQELFSASFLTVCRGRRSHTLLSLPGRRSRNHRRWSHFAQPSISVRIRTRPAPTRARLDAFAESTSPHTATVDRSSERESSFSSGTGN